MSDHEGRDDGDLRLPGEIPDLDENAVPTGDDSRFNPASKLRDRKAPAEKPRRNPDRPHGTTWVHRAFGEGGDEPKG